MIDGDEADRLCTRLAIMHRGRVVAMGTPAKLKSAVGDTDTTLDDVFIHYAEGAVGAGGAYRETSQIRRTAKRLGKAVSAGLRGLFQAVIICLLACLLGVRTNWHPVALIGVLAVVLLGAACFSTLSLIIAGWSRRASASWALAKC